MLYHQLYACSRSSKPSRSEYVLRPRPCRDWLKTRCAAQFTRSRDVKVIHEDNGALKRRRGRLRRRHVAAASGCSLANVLFFITRRRGQWCGGICVCSFVVRPSVAAADAAAADKDDCYIALTRHDRTIALQLAFFDGAALFDSEAYRTTTTTPRRSRGMPPTRSGWQLMTADGARVWTHLDADRPGISIASVGPRRANLRRVHRRTDGIRRHEATRSHIGRRVTGPARPGPARWCGYRYGYGHQSDSHPSDCLIEWFGCGFVVVVVVVCRMRSPPDIANCPIWTRNFKS